MSHPINQERLERVSNLLSQAQAVVATIDSRPQTQMSPADCFMETLAANACNSNLSDAEFRQFVLNSLSGMSRQG